MKRKILSLLLSLLLAVSVCTVPVYAENESTQITLSYDYDNISLFAGTKLILQTQTSGNGAGVKLLFSDDDSHYNEKAVSDSADSPSFEIELTEGPNYFVAQLIDSGGEVMASSESLLIEGYGKDVVRELWDVGFDSGVTAVPKAEGSTTIQFKDDSSAEILNSDGSKLAADTGNADTNSITVTDAPSDASGAEHGKALRIMTAAGAAGVCQLNSFGAKVTGSDDNAVVFKMDYLFENFNTQTPTKTMTVMGINDGSKWYPQLTLKNGNFTFEGKTKAAEPGVWYTVTTVLDFANDTIVCMVDGKVLGTGSIASGSGNTTRMRFSHEYKLADEALVTWTDNFSVSEVKFKKVSKEKLFVISSDVDTSSMYAGNKAILLSDVQNFPDAERVEYYISPDGETYELEASALPNEAAPVTLAYRTTFVKAVLAGSSGEEFAESNVLILDAVELSTVETVWDIDFENETLSKNGAVVYVCDENGEQLYNAYGNRFSANSGSEESVVEIAENSAGSPYGKSLRLYAANSNDEVQINELRASVMSDVILAEWDTCMIGEPSAFIPLRLWYTEGEDINTTRYVGPYLNYRPPKISFDGAGASFTMDEGIWYNIKMYVDTKTKAASCYIDDVYLGTLTTTKDIYSFFKVTNSIKGEGAECYVDNINVKRMSQKPEISDVRMTDDYTLEISFEEAVPTELFSENISDSLSIESGINKLNVKSASISDDGTLLTLTTSKKLYTAVDMTVTAELSDKSLLKKAVSLPARDFDIVNVEFTSSGTQTGVNATVKNDTQEDENAIMFMTVEKDGCIQSVQTALVQVTAGDTAWVSISPVAVNGGVVKVFFLDGWNTLTAVKDYVYTR